MSAHLAVFVALTLLAGAAKPSTAAAPAPPDMALWRLDCGRFDHVPMDDLADDGRYKGRRHDLTNSCYLVRHGADYLLWDAGYAPSMTMKGPDFTISGPKRTLADQLGQVGVRPAQVRYLALSHWHDDHIGQAGDFPAATLLIGRADWETVGHPPKDFDPVPLAAWISGRAAVEPVDGDRDVFGDGSVVMMASPGHTRGHHALAVRLPKTGVVILSGDLCHLRESCDHGAVPRQTEDRAAALASMAAIRALASREHATVVVGHDPDDVARLPAFPTAAR